MTYRILALGAALLLVLGIQAFAHHAPSGWQYPTACCSDRDCEPVAASDVFEELEFFALMTTGERYPRHLMMRSGDGGFHVCRKPNGAIRCFFKPDRMM